MIRRFNRFELKYVVTSSQRDALIAEIRERMAPDGVGGYRVTSLYFDTPDLAFFRSKLDGIKFRRKLRIRAYGDFLPRADPPAMVEIKQRINRTVQKRRLGLPLHAAYALCAGNRDGATVDEADADVAREVEYLVRTLGLGATCVVSYIRQAFVGGPYEPGLRLTFDHGLWSSGPERGIHGGERHHFLPLDQLILEVKANEAVPVWVVRLLARHSIQICRYSKYCAGLAHLRAQAHRRSHG